MNSAELRQSFLNFFEKKGHTIVPSAPLLPDSPNLLFTNAGMNQFVPVFLGERSSPYPSATDTQKCIRAGGKHNDLEDVGFDTYHHTFFEMLGNWSFGDYFKKEAIDWAWELLTVVWKLPKHRLYATVYMPEKGEPAEFDQEAHSLWTSIFRNEGLDPDKHVIFSGKKDNFWMMGDTGPCGPCSEIHIDLTPEGDSGEKLVNQDSGRCIEIWNLVFIQFNSNEDGTLSDLPAKNVDTGMGFERVSGIIATTKNFTDFSAEPSNYDSDLFSDIFKILTEECGKEYKGTIPNSRENLSDQSMTDFAFRVIADHLRTLSFSIADGILPGNEGRNYVLRRILRRAVLFGRKLDLPAGFFASLVKTLVLKMGAFFPELMDQQKIITSVIRSEEASFEKTISRGLQLLEKIALSKDKTISGLDAFTLYDTHGFPIDLTQLIAIEKRLELDMEGFEIEMGKQRMRSQKAIQKSVISLKDADEKDETPFVGFDQNQLLNLETKLKKFVYGPKDEIYLIFEKSNFYAEMGGQLGDHGTVRVGEKTFKIIDTLKDPSGQFLHRVDTNNIKDIDNWIQSTATLSVDLRRRKALQAHHSATHVLHWAMRQILGTHIRQAGSLVDSNRLRFDFSHFETVSIQDQRAIESLVNQQLVKNDSVQTFEVNFNDKPVDAIAFFGEKYSDTVRIVDIGGYSKELCGGTHVDKTGEIGFFKIVSESSISAGTRRIEAVVADSAANYVFQLTDQVDRLCTQYGCGPDKLNEKIARIEAQKEELLRKLERYEQKGQANLAESLAKKAIEKNGIQIVAASLDNIESKELRNIAIQISKKMSKSLILLGISDEKKSALLSMCSMEAIESGYNSGDIIRSISNSLGGKGGGKADFAMGGAPANKEQLKEAISLFISQNSESQT